ncbi:hypothetical protein WJX84_000884 [Apatococcus fuscideae]|uniref:Uncharacterized protein n=1 Tax=Apatococcus fuscideae TaxID=2026836 RepID=A0AAW1SND9_9CHLO
MRRATAVVGRRGLLETLGFLGMEPAAGAAAAGSLPLPPSARLGSAETDEDSKRQETLATVMRRLPDASLEDIVAVIEASAAAGLEDRQLSDAACKELIGDASQLKPEQLMATSMALAKIGHFSTDWKNTVSEHVRSNLGSFRPAVLAALVKAFGIAGYVDTAFYDMVSEYVEQNIKSLGPHHLAEIAFGASKGGCVTERLQSSVEKVAPDFVKQADMRGLSFFMEAYTLLRCFSNSIAEQAGHRFSHEMHGTDSGSVVRLMKAMTKLGQDDDQLFSSIAAELLDRGVHLLTPQDVSSVLSIFSGLMMYDKELVDAIVLHVLRHPQAFSEDLHKIQECCNNFGHYNSDLSEAVEKHGNPVSAGFQTA